MGQEVECQICARSRDRFQVLPCQEENHQVCTTCLQKLLREDYRCPFCRREWTRPQSPAETPILLKVAQIIAPNDSLATQEAVALVALVTRK